MFNFLISIFGVFKDFSESLYKVLKSTFGTQYDGDIILELEEINEPNLQKFGISIHSQDGRSVRIKRENISLEIKQIAQKL